IEQKEAEKLARKLERGKFDLDDLGGQLRQMQKMGGLSGMLDLLPGMSKAQMKNVKVDERVITRQLAMLSSMTPRERRRPELIKASRKQRIARGSGTTVQDVNKLLKQHQEAGRMMKRVRKMGKKGLMRGGLSSLMPPGGGGFPR
ncbi:MAG: signal recognition particle protein, partial [Kiloniellaceae bacterium]